MTDSQMKRRAKKAFPSARESEYGPMLSPVGSTSLRSHTAARWFRVFRTMDSSPLRQSSSRCSPLPIRSRLLKSIGVHIHLSAKQLGSSHYATPNKGRKRESPQKIGRSKPMSRLSLVEEPRMELLASYLRPVRARPKKQRANRQSQEALTPWEPGCLEISPMANSRPDL
jgi:hypothetical protein